jgi:hypothetical protein
MSDVEDYPDTGSYTMSPEEFSGVDTLLAWSAVAPEPDLPHHHDWGRMVKLASGIAAAALGVIVLVAVLLNPPGHAGSSTTTTTATAMPASQLPPITSEVSIPPVPFTEVPAEAAGHLSQDGDYLHRLRTAGLVGDLTAWEAAQNVRYGHAVCEALGRGFTIRQIAVYDHATHPNESWTKQEDEQWDRIAAAVYCPGLAR